MTRIRLFFSITAIALAAGASARAGSGDDATGAAKPTPTPAATYQVESLTLTRQGAIAIRGKTTPAELEDRMRTVMPRLIGHVGANQLDMAGPPYIRYIKRTAEIIEYEAGIPVLNPGKGDGDIVPAELPAGPAIATVHVGPYEGLPRAHAALAAWAKQHRKTRAGAGWEVFLTNPLTQRDPSKWRTKVFLPLAR